MRWRRQRFDVSNGEQTDIEEISPAGNQASAGGKARLGAEQVSSSAALADRLELVEETANTDVAGRATVEVEREHDHVKVRVPKFFEKMGDGAVLELEQIRKRT